MDFEAWWQREGHMIVGRLKDVARAAFDAARAQSAQAAPEESKIRAAACATCLGSGLDPGVCLGCGEPWPCSHDCPGGKGIAPKGTPCPSCQPK